MNTKDTKNTLRLALASCSMLIGSLPFISEPAAAAPPSPPPATMRYSKAVVDVPSPSEIAAGSTAAPFSFTVSNCDSATCDATHATTSTQKMGSATIAIPSGFSSVSSLSASASGGKTWNVSVVGGSIQLFAATGGDKLDPGQSVTVSFNANAACDAAAYEWTTTGFNGTDFLTAYTPFGAQPVVTITGSCDAFTGWQLGDYCTYGQGGWGANAHGDNPGAIRDANFEDIYLVAGVSVGIGYAMTFETAANVNDYLPACKGPSAMSSDFTNPIGVCSGPGSSATGGEFGGQVLALRLNLDYNAAGVLASNLTDFASVMLTDTGGTLDGQTVAAILNAAETALGGGALPAGYDLSSLNTLIDSLNHAFSECEPSDWAQAHLVP